MRMIVRLMRVYAQARGGEAREGDRSKAQPKDRAFKEEQNPYNDGDDDNCDDNDDDRSKAQTKNQAFEEEQNPNYNDYDDDDLLTIIFYDKHSVFAICN